MALNACTEDMTLNAYTEYMALNANLWRDNGSERLKLEEMALNAYEGKWWL